MRSVLFAPGNQPDVISKLPRTNPVAAVIDLEDSTPASHKAESRQIAFEATEVITKSCPLLIRINGIDTEWFEDVMRQPRYKMSPFYECSTRAPRRIHGPREEPTVASAIVVSLICIQKKRR